MTTTFSHRLSRRTLAACAIAIGATGAFDELYYLLEEAFIGDKLSPAFLYQVQSMQPFNTNPLFAILHEAIYAEGEATRWAADRVRGEFPAVNWVPGKDFAFTGEMVYPWMFEQFRELLPLKEAAHLLANKADWGALYDPAQLARRGLKASKGRLARRVSRAPASIFWGASVRPTISRSLAPQVMPI